MVDSIQASTSRSYQHSLRLPGILNGRGIRWLYLELVAKVRIVVTLLPSIRDKSSVKSTRTGADGESRVARTMGMPACASGSRGSCMARKLVVSRQAARGAIDSFRDQSPAEIEEHGWRKLNLTSASRRAYSRCDNPSGRWPRNFGRSDWRVGLSLNPPRNVQALPERGRRTPIHSANLPHWFVVNDSIESGCYQQQEHPKPWAIVGPSDRVIYSELLCTKKKSQTS